MKAVAALVRRYLPLGQQVAQPEDQLPLGVQRPIPKNPEEVAARMNRIHRRRLSDRFYELFQEACLSGDLVTAEELLTMVEDAEKQRRANFGGDRRKSDDFLALAREELAWRKKVARTPAE